MPSWALETLIPHGPVFGEQARITGQVIINGLGGRDRIDVAKGVRLGVVVNGVEVNHGNQGKGHGTVQAQVSGRVSAGVLLAHDGHDKVPASSNVRHHGKGRGAEDKPKPATLSQTLLQASQAKKVDAKGRATAATAQALADLVMADYSKRQKSR